jgi:hypothetical protein
MPPTPWESGNNLLNYLSGQLDAVTGCRCRVYADVSALSDACPDAPTLAVAVCFTHISTHRDMTASDALLMSVHSLQRLVTVTNRAALFRDPDGASYVHVLFQN